MVLLKVSVISTIVRRFYMKTYIMAHLPMIFVVKNFLYLVLVFEIQKHCRVSISMKPDFDTSMCDQALNILGSS